MYTYTKQVNKIYISDPTLSDIVNSISIPSGRAMSVVDINVRMDVLRGVRDILFVIGAHEAHERVVVAAGAGVGDGDDD